MARYAQAKAQEKAQAKAQEKASAKAKKPKVSRNRRLPLCARC